MAITTSRTIQTIINTLHHSGNCIRQSMYKIISFGIIRLPSLRFLKFHRLLNIPIGLFHVHIMLPFTVSPITIFPGVTDAEINNSTFPKCGYHFVNTLMLVVCIMAWMVNHLRFQFQILERLLHQMSPAFRCSDFSAEKPSGYLAFNFSILVSIASSIENPNAWQISANIQRQSPTSFFM